MPAAPIAKFFRFKKLFSLHHIRLQEYLTALMQHAATCHLATTCQNSFFGNWISQYSKNIRPWSWKI